MPPLLSLLELVELLLELEGDDEHQSSEHAPYSQEGGKAAFERLGALPDICVRQDVP